MRWRSIISSFTVFVLIFSLGIQQAFAAPLTSVSDTLSDDLINNTSDHTIQFTFPTGRYITDDVFYIDFDANFTMAGAWATSDFSTINEDGTEGGFNSWNVFEVDTVDPSGACFMYTDGDVAVVYDNDANRLKFKFCNDGSSVAPQTNAVITFTIYGTGGNGTLTNPSSAGVYLSPIYDDLSSFDSTNLSSTITGGAPVTPTFKDTLTNQTISETSNHEVLFITNSGVAAGETITLTFESDFSIPVALNFEDLDLSYEASGGDNVCDTGDTEITLAASASGSTWGAVRTSSTVITLTSATGTIPANAQVCIEIGTNAEEAVTGVEQITNPTAVGDRSYSLTIGGTMVDSGYIAIPIVDSSFVVISANVDPSITFDIDTLVADSQSGVPYTVDLGILTTTPVSSGTTIFSIWLDLDTNASGGAVVTVKNANGPSGLVSTSVPADNIPSADANQDPSVANYGICVISATESVTEPGTFAAEATYKSGLCAVDGVNNDVGGLLATSTPILNTANAPIAEGRARISVNAAISGVTPAHNDYTDTLTFIATGTF